MMNTLKNKIRKVMNENEQKYFSKCKSDTDVLKQFEQLLIEWESKIAKEHEKTYTTDIVENHINGQVIEWILFFLKEAAFEKEDAAICISIFRHRHVGYNMYRIKNQFFDEKIQNGLDFIYNNSEYETVLYCAMADFYAQFTGTFSTNEEAIEFLCKFYPKDMVLNTERQENIAEALFHHIVFAGTTSDFGYAYNGIAKIEKYIWLMPIKIVEDVLEKYERYRVENQPVHRHQMYSIIKESALKDKIGYKFYYIDSAVLIRCVTMQMFKIIIKEDDKIDIDYPALQSFTEKKIDFLIRDNGEVYAYWQTQEKKKAELFVEGKSWLTIEFGSSGNNKNVICLRHKGKTKSMLFRFDDWMANEYFSKSFEKSLADYLEATVKNSDFVFSYIYLNGYRGIQNQKLSFDHRFEYDRRKKSITKTQNKYFPGKFYGKKVYSLSCIVGENGRGKTSIIDFMRDSFFKIIDCVDRKLLEYQDNTVKLSEQWMENLRLNDDVEFLVVFRMDGKDYFLTNISNVTYKWKEVRAYVPSFLLGMAAEGSKILYFSGKINMYDDKISRSDSKEQEQINIINQTHSIDYSENIANYRRIQNILAGTKKAVNRELCYQLTFLRHHKDEDFQWWFGAGFEKEKLMILDKRTINQKYSDDLPIQQLLFTPDCQLSPFSSGEYNKLSFLSKLYWCLEGGERFREENKTLEDMGIFHMREVVQKGDAVILFIDEGEVYYHPEWQRQYVRILLEMIDRCSKSEAVQIVLTTHSPFMISDILEEDIMYLPPQETKSVKKTFGQNIHMLLKSSFFMRSTIGEYAKGLIEWLLNLLNDENKSYEEVAKDVNERFYTNLSAPEEVYDFLEQLISNIGEEIYRTELLRMLRKFRESNLSRLEILKREKLELEKQIAALEKTMSGEKRK